jgi:demethoxyubiquinone hydroxylase (CLK1/Coq7/Cat5 family)
MQQSPLPVSRICFAPVRLTPRRSSDVVVRLSDAHAYAVAELLQVLACGEESAAFAFDHLAERYQASSLRLALAAIADDELEHQVLLDSLRRSLPSPLPDAAFQSAMRRFFMRLGARDVLVHCVRIVAIDSAVCHLLGALRRHGSPLAAESALSAVLGRIHRDEARHVALAKRCAVPLLETTRGRDIAADARDRLVRVLELRASALDVLLVDPGRLFARLRSGLRVAGAA